MAGVTEPADRLAQHTCSPLAAPHIHFSVHSPLGEVKVGALGRVWGQSVSMAGCPRHRPELGSSEKKANRTTKNRTAECIHQVWEPRSAFKQPQGSVSPHSVGGWRWDTWPQARLAMHQALGGDIKVKHICLACWVWVTWNCRGPGNLEKKRGPFSKSLSGSVTDLGSKAERWFPGH